MTVEREKTEHATCAHSVSAGWTNADGGRGNLWPLVTSNVTNGTVRDRRPLLVFRESSSRSRCQRMRFKPALTGTAVSLKISLFLMLQREYALYGVYTLSFLTL